MEGQPAEGAVVIEASVTPRINLAFHLNAVPVVRELVVANGGEAPLEGLELALSSTPEFLAPRSWRIDSLGAGQRHHLPLIDVAMNGGLLSRLTEAESAGLHLTLTAEGREVARRSLAIELLPRNHWGGLGHMPDMVAAFVQPNDPAVERLLKRAAGILRENGRDPALNGYAGGAQRAWEIASAVWTAVGAQGLDYVLPPASFEHAGQKVRSPGQILDAGLATCLDTTLLFCAALEQCGLHPLVVFTQGHAFAGLWLKAEEFVSAVVDDVTALRKRLRLNEMLLFETTLATQRPLPAFSRAAARGAEQVAESQEDRFELAVDLRRARLQRIRPLAAAEAAVPASPPEEAAAEPPFEPAPELPAETILPEEPRPSHPQGRLDRWQRKLLDLSLRNSLLNFRATRRVIRLDAPEPGRLEDRLVAGRRLRLLPRPELMQGEDPRSQALHEARHQEDLRRAQALEALERDQVLVELLQPELEARLVELFRQARANLQEGGANTLFLAFGFLVWKRNPADAKGYRAPLVLLPVTLERKSIRSGFTLLLHEDEPRFNPTLLEMLRQDFRLQLPVGEGELPKDEAGLDIGGIWRQVAQAVKEIQGWEVSEEVALASFSFAKFLMWKDLVERTDQLKQNPVVSHLIERPGASYPSSQAFVDPRSLDRLHAPQETFCPLPADSSQLAAVMAGARGKDFVLVGPPGTGKSQTIANLIAQCLAERKTVLFVSEKIAALEVVYRRLREIGLGDFCLELHSSKARKLGVLEQLRRAWEAKGEADEEGWLREAQRLKGLRDQLNLYVEHLHRRHRNGLTAHLAIGRILSGAALPRLGLAWPSPDSHDADALQALADLAERLDVNAAAVGRIVGSPFAPVAQAEWSPLWQRSLVEAAEALPPAAGLLEAAGTAFAETLALRGALDDARRRDALRDLAALLPGAAGRDWRFALRPDAGSLADALARAAALVREHRALLAGLGQPAPADAIAALRRSLELLARHRETADRLSHPYGPAAAGLDLPALQAAWAKAERAIWPFSAMGRGKVERALAAALPEGREPVLPGDLETLAALRALEREVTALGLSIERTAAPWKGLASLPEELEATARLQAALAAAHGGGTWTDEGMEPVAAGRCGEAAAADLARLRRLHAIERALSAGGDLGARSGGLWAGLRTDLEELGAALAFREALSRALAVLAEDAGALADAKSALERLLGSSAELLGPQGQVTRLGQGYTTALADFDAALERFRRACASSAEELAAVLGEHPADLATAAALLPPREAGLRAWCAWRKARGEAAAAGLAPLVAGLESGAVAQGNLPAAFATDYARWWLDALVEDDIVLRSFVSAEHENRIATFRALDDRFTALTRDYIRAGLCAALPAPDSIDRGSGWSLLKKEMQKKRAHLPLRRLLQGTADALPLLTPCLLMSPLSIAQYLSVETAPFDLVVFDEASQIPVWDAVGALARGRQVVMVGDPKQLPPTSFFERSEEDADEAVESELESDMESILDECIGANLPTLDLTWHYRSRHESLIAFSNHRYYGGRLITFPSPTTDDRAVSFHHVPEGAYEKGGARTNKPEARALVADLVQRLRDPVFVAARRSAGVVTLNGEQQRLVEDLLDEERRRDPELEPHFAADALEPVFVKNLENVQGDERDVIYFSLGYGPDRSGAVSMNFGPMNRSGGQRRLNVAITRARHAVRVFSSLKAEQIDLSRTRADGVRDLKHFLEFAERGPRALAEAVFGSIGRHEFPFEQAVAAALAARGWQVHPQVGVSSFRIDLAVVDPDAPGRYLAGIECDGATYHRSAAARDRDKLREQVLRGLGWEIRRIWSPDWWHDPVGSLEKLHRSLEVLLADARARRTAEAERSAAEAAVREAAIASAPAAETASDEPPLYREADLAALPVTLDATAFHEPGYDATLLALVEAVVDCEAPLREDLLVRRIARAHGWARTGARIQARVLTLVERCCRIESDGSARFVWHREADPAAVERFRRPAGEPRGIDEIPLPELAALAREVRAEGLTGDAAVAAMARAAGLQQLRQASRERLQAAWASLAG